MPVSLYFLALLPTALASSASSRPAATRRQANAEVAGWSVLLTGGSEGTAVLDATKPRKAEGLGSLRLTATRLGAGYGARFGVVRGGFRVAKKATYDVAFFARTDGARVGLVFSLESEDGKRVFARTTLPEIGGEWQPYKVALAARAGASNARLVISPIEPTTIWLDSVSAATRKGK